MATFAFLKSSLIVFVSLLLSLTTVSARQNDIHPQNFPAIGGPRLPAAQIALFYQSFRDAVLLAKHTAMYWPCDPANDKAFLRYFRPDDARFVRDMFRTIANIPLDLDLSDKDAVAQLAAEPLSYHPKFNRLSIYFLGDHPGIDIKNGGPGIAININCGNNKIKLQAYALALYNGASALLSVCKFAFMSAPMLQDVTNPPAWAVDPNKDQSHKTQFYDGYGCENLGDTDSNWMDSTAAIILHELFHFPGLFADVPDYGATIPLKGVVPGSGPGSGPIEHQIDDWYGKGKTPPNGYGAYNAKLVNDLHPLDKNGRPFLAIYNADNYAWYALNSYFSKTCGKEFQECPSNAAALSKPRYPAPWPFDVSPA